MKIHPSNFIALIVFVTLLIYFFKQRAYAAMSDTHDLKKQIDQTGTGYLADHSNGALVIAFYQRGNKSFQGFGKTSGSNANPPDARTIFEIGSVTKNFTATMLAKMADDGSVKLDDPITLYLPKDVVSPKKNGHEITLENLATHTSGLPRLPENLFATVKDQRNPYANYTTEDLYKSLATVQLAGEPGEKSVYSNYGYGLLGKILELKAGKPYETLIQEMICVPLDLKNTTTKLSAEQKEQLTLGHNSKGEIVPNWDQDAMAPAGAICSDAEDMLKFIEANLGKTNSEISKALNVTQEVHFKTISGGIGLGWQIKQMAGAPTVFWHNGGTGGYRSFVGFDKQNQVGVVVLSNYGDAKDSSVDQMGMKLLKIGSKVSLE
ncbi:MAG TPA: serine hydrolase domain-containing protein [Verrucomicrobiae bacterium]|jgi:CubicO group peptidase (beta-lactamase class C family)|nr:serine hydrolase domain-containing protein [Verrucomicrobiae bacterium]